MAKGNAVSLREETFSAVEAARRLGVGLDYLYGLLWTGKLQGQKVGGRWAIPAAAVEARLKARQGQRGEAQ
jgi:excisionase family DNA binding protein